MDTITDHEAREEYAEGLRHLADLLQYSDLPLPYATGAKSKHEMVSGPISFYLFDEDVFRRTVRELGATEVWPDEEQPDDVVYVGRLAGLHFEVRLFVRDYAKADAGEVSA